MQVSDIMTPKVITINEEKSLLEVRELMANNNLRRVPVVNDIGCLRGIVTDGDVSRSAPSAASTLSKYEANYLLGKLKVKDIMKKAVITVKKNDAIETIAYLLYKNKIGAIPVIDENSKVCGIVSDTDVFKVLMDILELENKKLIKKIMHCLLCSLPYRQLRNSNADFIFCG